MILQDRIWFHESIRYWGAWTPEPGWLFNVSSPTRPPIALCAAAGAGQRVAAARSSRPRIVVRTQRMVFGPPNAPVLALDTLFAELR